MWDRTFHPRAGGGCRAGHLANSGQRLPGKNRQRGWGFNGGENPSVLTIGSWWWDDQGMTMDDPYAIDAIEDDWPPKEKPLKNGSMAIPLGGLRWSQGLHKSGTYDLGLCLSAHALPQGTRWPLPSWGTMGTGVSWDGNVEFFNESLGIWEAHKKTANKSTKLMLMPGVAERPPIAIQKHVQMITWPYEYHRNRNVDCIHRGQAHGDLSRCLFCSVLWTHLMK